jgi:hypothetical protein
VLRHQFLIAVVILTVPQALTAQATCRATFDSVVAFTERNYLGYHLEVTPATRVAYRARTAVARAAATDAAQGGCFVTIRAWVDAWEDGHLFLQEPLNLDTIETGRRIATVPRRAVPDSVTVARFETRGRDDLTGHWHDRGLRVVIMPGAGEARWEAIVTQADTAGWEPGMVRAEFTARPGGGYDVLMRERNHAVRRFIGTLHRGVLLRMPPHMWGRSDRVPELEQGGVDAVDPRRPTIRAIDATVVIAMPSHDPRFAAPLRALLAEWHDRIVATEPLVLDLRGNEGGSGATGTPLLAYARGDSLLPRVFPVWRPTVVASADHLAWARSFVRDGQAPTPVVGRLIERMAASPGAIVRYIDDADLPPEADWPESAGGPARVMVLTDRGVVSAGETFVAQLRRSPKVTTWGEPTGGVLDYQMTRLVGIGVAPFRVVLGYPTIGNHPELPDGGIRRTGFAPTRPHPAGGGELIRAAIRAGR